MNSTLAGLGFFIFLSVLYSFLINVILLVKSSTSKIGSSYYYLVD